MPEIQNRNLLSGREYIGVDKIDGSATHTLSDTESLLSVWTVKGTHDWVLYWNHRPILL